MSHRSRPPDLSRSLTLRTPEMIKRLCGLLVPVFLVTLPSFAETTAMDLAAGERGSDTPICDLVTSTTDAPQFVTGGDNQTLDSVTDPDPFGYTNFTFTVMGTGSDPLTPAILPDFFYFGLDDVSLVPAATAPVPEPLGMLLLGVALFAIVSWQLLAKRSF